jgi:hypothetical protein
MMFFTSQEMYNVFEPYYQALTLDAEIGPKLVAVNTCVRLVHHNPKAVFVLDARRDPAMVLIGRGAGCARPELEFELPADDIHAFWLGQLNLPLALECPRTAATGPSDKLRQLLRVFDLADGRYRAHLYAIGRHELV